MLDTPILPETPMMHTSRDNTSLDPGADRVDVNLATYIAPRTPLEAQLAQMWSKFLGLERVSVEDDFFDLGGDSLIGIDLLEEISNVLGCDLPLTALFQHQTIAKQALAISAATAVDRQPTEAATEEEWQFIVPIKIVDSQQPPFFLIHDIGGDVMSYRQLVKHLPADRSCYGLQPLGLDGKQAPIASVPEMAARYIQAIQAVQSTGAYHLIGYSFGGTVAAEMARQLHALDRPIGLLMLLDSVPTAVYLSQATETQAQTKSNFGARLLKFCRLSLQDKIHYINAGINKYRNFGKLRTPYLLYLRYLKHTSVGMGSLDVYYANLAAFQNYAPASIYPGAAILFCSSERQSDRITSEYLDWDRSIGGKIDVCLCTNTNHQSITQEPCVREIAARLNTYLDGAVVPGESDLARS